MLQLAANLSTLFADLPLPERFAAAAESGFRAVEIQFPYALAPDELRLLLERNELALVLFNAPPGDLAAGERGLAGVPGREADFRASLARVREYAEACGCPRVHVMAGMRATGMRREDQLALLEANLREARGLVGPAGPRLLLEPINTRVDVPGYLLDDTADAVAIIERLGQGVGLQFDFYHQQIQHGDLARRFDALLPVIHHVQLADNPGRHEPGTGEIRYDYLLEHVARSPYEGWVGCEYHPLAPGGASLEWARSWLGR